MASYGCSDPAPGPAPDPLGVECSSAHPSYATDVEPIFESSCRGEEGCHGLPTRENMVGMTLGEDDCDLARIDVSPGSLDKSYLMHKLTGVGMCPSTSTMPPGSTLARADLQTIADWICEGAPAN